MSPAVSVLIALVAFALFFMILGLYVKRRNEKKRLQFEDLAARYQLELLVSKSFLKGQQLRARGKYNGIELEALERVVGSGKNRRVFTVWQLTCSITTYRFTIRKENFGSRLVNWLGGKDIQFRDEKIDDTFRFKSDNEDEFRALMQHNLLYELMNLKNELQGTIEYDKGMLEYRVLTELTTEERKRTFESILPFLMKLAESINPDKR